MTYDAAFKFTGAKLQLLYSPELHLWFDRGIIRGNNGQWYPCQEGSS